MEFFQTFVGVVFKHVQITMILKVQKLIAFLQYQIDHTAWIYCGDLTGIQFLGCLI